MTVTQDGTYTQVTDSLLTVGSFLQNGAGTNVIGDDITSDQAGGITFSELVTLTSTVVDDTIVFDSSTNNGNITFDAPLNLDGQSLKLTSGTGDITFEKPVGEIGDAGNIIINVANNVTVNAAMNVASFYTSGIDGTITLNGAVTRKSTRFARRRELFVNRHYHHQWR